MRIDRAQDSTAPRERVSSEGDLAVYIVDGGDKWQLFVSGKALYITLSIVFIDYLVRNGMIL